MSHRCGNKIPGLSLSRLLYNSPARSRSVQLAPFLQNRDSCFRYLSKCRHERLWCRPRRQNPMPPGWWCNHLVHSMCLREPGWAGKETVPAEMKAEVETAETSPEVNDGTESQ